MVVGTIWLPAPQETAALVKSSLESLARPANYLFCIWASDSHASDCATLRKMGAAKKVPKAAPDPKATLAKSKADAQGFKCVKCMQVCHRPCCHADCHALITLSYHTSRCTSKQAPPASPCPHLLGHAFLQQPLRRLLRRRSLAPPRWPACSCTSPPSTTTRRTRRPSRSALARTARPRPEHCTEP